jgi:3-oxoacyl-[acyl-carrier protein] reductase
MNILIIGGSSDIGVSLGHYLSDKGCNVIATYHHNKRIDDKIQYLKCNILDIEDINKIFDEVGKIDVLINMAAISLDNEFEDITEEDFTNVLKVNLVGPFLTSRTYLKNNKGIILNISSTDGIDTFNKYNISYAASKSGLITMSKNLSLLTDSKVYCLCPNWIDSDSTNNMDQKFLNSELKRINQNRLITKEELNKSIYKILTEEYSSGSIFRLDVKGDKLCLEKIS